MLYVDPTGEDYDLYQYDKKGKPTIFTLRVTDLANLPKGYSVSGGDGNGTYYVKGPKDANGNVTMFSAKYVGGDPGGVTVQAQYNISARFAGVGAELDRSANASMQAIYIVGAVNLAPAVLASATLSGGTITTLNIARPLVSVSQTALKELIGKEGTILLRRLLTSGKLPAGLSRAALESYRELAIRIIASYAASGKSPDGIAEQTRRLEIIEKALEKLK